MLTQPHTLTQSTVTLEAVIIMTSSPVHDEYHDVADGVLGDPVAVDLAAFPQVPADHGDGREEAHRLLDHLVHVRQLAEVPGGDVLRGGGGKDSLHFLQQLPLHFWVPARYI